MCTFSKRFVYIGIDQRPLVIYFVPLLGLEPRHYASKAHTTTNYVIKAFELMEGLEPPLDFRLRFTKPVLSPLSHISK